MKKSFKLFCLSVLSLGVVLGVLSVLDPPNASADPAGRWQGLTSITISSNAVGAQTGYTNVIATGSSRIDVPRADTVIIYGTYKLVAAGTSAVDLHFRPMIDETTPVTDSTQELVISTTAAGATTVSFFTNWATPYPYYQFYRATNVNAAAVTNLVIKYGTKQ